MYKLSTEKDTVIRLFDNAHIRFDLANPDYQQYLEWVGKGNVPEPPYTIPTLPISPKIIGIEFEGVMCSATKEDQNGLIAVQLAYQLQGNSFKPTRYEFANGSKLVITKENIQRFISVWMPFRQSFFTTESIS